MSRRSSFGSQNMIKWFSHDGRLNAVHVRMGARSDISAVLLSIRVYLAARDRPAVIVTETDERPSGLITLALLLAITRKRKLVLVEFCPGGGSGRAAGLVDSAYRMLLGRVCLGLHVTSEADRHTYAARYRIPLRLIHCIRPNSSFAVHPEVTAGYERFGILASGGNEDSDLVTLLEAAEGQQWPLTIVSNQKAHRKYSGRAKSIGVNIIKDIPQDDQDRLIASSRIYVQLNGGAGLNTPHSRLTAAAIAGTPAIGASVEDRDDAFELTVACYRAGSVADLRSVINRYLEISPSDLEASVGVVRRRAAERTRLDYERDLSVFLECFLDYGK